MIRTIPPLRESENLIYADLVNNSFGIKVSGFVKRVFDLTFSLFGILILSPFLALVAILIKRDSPGPVFYWGPRIGLHGATFKMLKFRTMYETPESYNGPRVTAREDNRITPLGKWLRNTKLNELPQLWNVLKGEMSLVGPRPEDPTICKTWPTSLALEILSVRPGVTSPASVVYRDEESMLRADEVMQKYLHELSPDKMRLDQLYVRYRSFWLDLDVILWTILLLVPKIRSYSPPEQLLFVGPVTRLIQRYLSWLVWDFLVVWASIVLACGIVRIFGPLDIGWLMTIELALGFSVVFNLIGLLLKTNRINWTKAPSRELGRLWFAWLIAVIVMLSGYYYFGFTSLRIYIVILGSSILSLLGISIVRYRGQLLNSLSGHLVTHQLDARAIRERVLLVGSGRTAEHIAWLMDHPTYSGKFQIVGVIDDDLLSQGMKIYGSRVIGKIEDIQTIVKKYDIGLIILADNRIASHKFREFRNTDSFSPARIVVAPDIFGSLSSLDGEGVINEANDNFNNFQCQHCLARYTANQEQS